MKNALSRLLGETTMLNEPVAPARRGVVAVITDGDRLLIIRRSRHVVAPRAICFPGGGIESGESESQALTREIDEELGAAIVPIRCLWRSTTAWNVELSWWLARLVPPIDLKPNPAEVESLDWLTPSELLLVPELLASNREFLAAVLDGRVQLSAV